MKTRTTCRLCSGVIEVVWSLEPTPLANELVTKEFVLSGAKQDTFPLDLAVCATCGHVQLAQVVEPERLFRNYPYTSGASPVYVKHLKEYARELVERFAPKRVLEIASNDGTMLEMFKKRGVAVLGVEPAKNLSNISEEKGVETLRVFFTGSVAKVIAYDYGLADLIVANHVMAHIDDLDDVVRGVDALLAPDGVFVFEVGYLGDVLAGAHFDTIYHEHLSYHHLTPLVPFFKRFGMHLFDAERVDTQGGSIRCFVRRFSGGSVRLASLLAAEFAVDPVRRIPGTIDHMRHRVDELRDWLIPELRQLKRSGARIVGYGAPAKAVTFLHQLGIGAETLDYVVDDAPLKQGRYLPGKQLEILPPSAMLDIKPDVVLVLAWNFAESIMDLNHGSWRWIVPAP